MKSRILILLPFIIFSCSRGNIFEEYKKFDNLTWNRFNILSFETVITDTESPYSLFIHIRHLPEFNLEELKINFTVTTPSGSMRTSDHVLKFTGKEGNPLSSCMGDLCDILIPVRESYYFTEHGVHRFEIENKFTKLELRGIMEAGLVIRKMPVE
ncbi:MAG: hypothetical protein JXA03_09995 [Bacteroidales bacterium]|nr:hypothetical protein [Bacteroidales bacterium]